MTELLKQKPDSDETLRAYEVVIRERGDEEIISVSDGVETTEIREDHGRWLVDGEQHWQTFDDRYDAVMYVLRHVMEVL